MRQEEIPTPALTIDLTILERNLDRVAVYCCDHKLGLRPHAKTHKTSEVARMQSTVVSTEVHGRAIIDAGSKTLSSDTLHSGPKTGYGCVMEFPEAKLFSLKNTAISTLPVLRTAFELVKGSPSFPIMPVHASTCRMKCFSCATGR